MTAKERDKQHRENWRIVMAMESTGGGFVRSLAEAWKRADGINARRLQEAFPEYWDTYRGRADDIEKQEHSAIPIEAPNNRPADGRVCDCEDAPCCGHYE